MPKDRRVLNQDSNQEPVFSQKEFYCYKVDCVLVCFTGKSLRIALFFPINYCLDLDNAHLFLLVVTVTHVTPFFLLLFFSPVSNFCVRETNHPILFLGFGVEGCFKPFQRLENSMVIVGHLHFLTSHQAYPSSCQRPFSPQVRAIPVTEAICMNRKSN